MSRYVSQWFAQSTPISDRTPFNDESIQLISDALRTADRISWSRTPRIYTVLRIVGKQHPIESFMNGEITDLWFPFEQQILPLCLTDQAVRDEIFERTASCVY